MSIDSRHVAIATAGFCAFLNLYSPQALLPELAREFPASAGAFLPGNAGCVTLVFVMLTVMAVVAALA